VDIDEECLVLIDREDRPVGVVGKLAGHRQGLLHRALSVVVRDREGRFLLQKRQAAKYHSGGLWTNTCCSHPRISEAVGDAAHRRLQEEMGFDCPLIHRLATYYYADLDGGMIEHEIVHVFSGIYSGPVAPHPGEADGFAWVEPDELLAEIAQRPERFSVWFRKYVGEHWSALTAETPSAEEEDRLCVS
jgi:isopentenyl-diphosphate Delta-isomerase